MVGHSDLVKLVSLRAFGVMRGRKEEDVSKRLHKGFLTFVNSKVGIIVCFLGALSFAFHSVSLVLGYLGAPTLFGSQSSHSSTGQTYNIGGIVDQQFMGYDPIDIVYTWVNGSDPVWLREKEQWGAIYGLHNGSTADETSAAMGGVGKGSMSASGNETAQDDRMSSNRYRDSDELRYSIRSVVKYAPWVRRIYIVTADQVPWWLDTSHPLIHIVTHEEIFPNRSHLPVFSSPAIEAHLHRIPGLSKHFIYFNDDVFLGAPTSPEDFVSVEGRQKLIMAWDVPKCSPGCVDSWLGDGYCDKACNVSACNFDFPDCVNGTNTKRGRAGSLSIQCSKGCPDSWLGDKTCDLRCQTA